MSDRVRAALAAVIEGRSHPGLEPLKRGRSGWLTRIGGVLSGPVPMALRLFGRRSRTAHQAAAVCTVIGSVVTRFAWIAVGNVSAEDPRVPLRLEPTDRGQLERARDSAIARS